MNKPYRFDLDVAVAAWRRTLTHRAALDDDDRDELERHVRDEVAALVAKGWHEAAAFDHAVGGVGAHGAVEAEYGKVYWGKARRRGVVLHELTWRLSMLKNYVVVALRALGRHPFHTTLNVLGLAVAVGAVILLGLFVAHERSYDRFHADADRIVVLAEVSVKNGETVNTSRLTRTPALPTLLREEPAVESGTRLQPWGTESLAYDGRRFDVPIVIADSGFFDVFTFDVLAGDGRRAVSQPGAVALTESAAKRMFGDEDPVGKSLDHNHGADVWTVAAVVADPPPNSSIRFEALAGWTNLGPQRAAGADGAWYNSNTYTALRLRPGTDRAVLAERLEAFRERYYTPYAHADVRLIAQPFVEVRSEEAGNGPLLAMLGVIAAVILLVAGINFTNLSTAQAFGRAREVGMRKVLGAYRGQLAGQFVGESMLLSGLALVLGTGLAALALPTFNGLFDLPLALDLLRHGPALLGLGLALGLLAGLYPALYLSALQPIRTLKGRGVHQAGGRRLRQGLVVLQFALSIFLISGTFIVARQVDYMKHRDLRFDGEHVVVVPVQTAPLGGREAAGPRWATVRDALLADPAVRSASFSTVVPGRYWFDYNTYYPDGDETRGVSMRQVWGVDARYFETYGIEVVEDAGFRADAPSANQGRVVINRTAAERIGYDGTQQLVPGGSGSEPLAIAGVVDDFHYQSMVDAIEPLIHRYGGEDPAGYRYLSVRLVPGATEAGMDLLRHHWTRLYGDEPFVSFFIDEEFDALYRAQERIGAVAATFAGLAVVLACLGLLALAAFTIEARTKEIGIRKALGATTGGVTLLLTQGFAGLVALAGLVAAPLAYVVMRRWLADFAYRIDLGAGPFLLAAALALAIALLTVGLRAARAARLDPARTLRYE